MTSATASLQEVDRENAAIETIEGRLLSMPQVDVPVTHRFAPGVYWREVTIPAGSFIIGHRHKTAHFNILLKGRLRVLVDGKVREVSAPFVVVSEPGRRKAALALEDSIWVNIHPTDETDPAKLEALLIEKSPTFLEFELQAELAQLEASV